MKKLLFFVMALFMVGSAFSQEVRFGVKAGVNLASLSDVESSGSGISIKVFEKDGMAIGYHGGVFANIGFGKFIGFQPELLFSMQGGKHKMGQLFSGMDDFGDMDLEIDGPAPKVSYQLGYVALPLLLEIKPVDNLGILVGPQVGYNLTRSATSSFGGEKETISGKDFDNDFLELKKFDAGVTVGLQYTIAGHLNIGARYYLGLLDGYSETEDGVTTKGFKNGVIQASIGYSF